MSLAELSEQPGKVATIESHCDYIADPLNTFVHLCGSGQNNLLLESAEIDSKHDLKSLIMVDAAVKLVCNGHKVNAQALTQNGVPVISFLRNAIEQCKTSNDIAIVDVEEDSASQQLPAIEFTFQPANALLDEDSRLKSASVFDVLRILQTQLQPLSPHPMAIFVGGTFAYDLLATAEQLPEVSEGDNDCPDYVFYLAETLITIDHQLQSSQILGSVFSGDQVASSYFQVSQRIEFLKKTITDRKSTRLNSSHPVQSRMPSSA